MSKFSLKLPLAIAVVGAAAFFSATGNWPVPRWSDIATSKPIVVTSPFRIVTDTLHAGENVATLLGRQGVSGLNLQSLAIALSFDPKKIRAGLIFSVHRDGVTGEANHVEFRPNADQRLQFIRTSTGWIGNAVPIRWSVDTARMSAGISTSLYEAFDHQIQESTLELAERRKLANDLTNIFEGQVSFSEDLQRGDQFAVVYERLTSEEGEVRYSRILAASLVVDEKEHTAFHWRSNDKDLYYDVNAKALTSTFLREPLEYRYVSSNFSSGRFHPILGRMRAHEGTDYAADRGTPVRATGDGVVTVAGWSGGYGNLVEIRHTNGVVTRYGHLQQVLTRVGAHVSQSDKIGLVGATGLATGPHLHYEFRVNGAARNPRDLKFQQGAPLLAGVRIQFDRERDVLRDLLYLHGAGPVIVAH